MPKNLKKILASFIILLSLSACEKKDVSETAGDGTPGKGVKMQIWTTEEVPFFQSLGREYVAEKAIPNLQFKVVKFNSNQELQEFYTEALAEGYGPDIIYTNGDWIHHNIGKFIYAENEGDGFDVDNYKNTFAEAVNETLIVQDRIYGVPLAVDTLALLFNDEHIKDRLLDRNFPGRTWENFKKDISSLTKTDNSFQRFAYSGAALGRFDNVMHGKDILENIMIQMGVTFFDESGTQALFADSTSQEVDGRKINIGVEAVNFFTSFADNRFKNYSWNEFIATPNSQYKDYEPFVLGKTSMIFVYLRDLQNIKNISEHFASKRSNVISEKNMRLMKLPQIHASNDIAPQRVMARVYGMGVSRVSKYPDTAWGFLKFAVQKKNLKSWHDQTKYPSPRVDMLREQMEDPEVEAFVRQVKISRANLMPIEKNEFFELFSPYIQAINERKIAIDKALSRLATQLTNKIRAQKKKEQEINIDSKKKKTNARSKT